MCCPPMVHPKQPTMCCLFKTMLRNNHHVTHAGPAVMPTNSADKSADSELRSKTTTRYFISIQVRYSLLQFGA